MNYKTMQKNKSDIHAQTLMQVIKDAIPTDKTVVLFQLFNRPPGLFIAKYSGNKSEMKYLPWIPLT